MAPISHALEGGDGRKGDTYRRPTRISLIQATQRIRSVSPHVIRQLSTREAQVVTCLAQGKQVQDAAAILGISPNTISAHLYKAVRKLRVSNRAELTIAAIRLGIVKCPCPKHAVKPEVAS